MGDVSNARAKYRRFIRLTAKYKAILIPSAKQGML